MKKIFLLSLLLIPTATHCMLTKTTSNLNSYLNKAKFIKKCTTMHDFPTKEVNDLGDKLYAAQLWRRISNDDPMKYLVPFKYPERIYGYVENNGAGKYYKESLLDYNAYTLREMTSLKNACYNGYSGIGIATLATSVSYEEKKYIIRKLLFAGYEPTPKDRLLALQIEQQAGITLPNGKSDLLDRE